MSKAKVAVEYGISKKYLDLIPGLPVIRTSDRIAFKRCRRKWNWSSHLRAYLEPMEASHAALWFGTGFHFAMEDYHGYNRFGHPIKAFEAYVTAWRSRTLRAEIPDDHVELLELGRFMLAYYADKWLPRRSEFQTYWLNGVPQVEVNFQILLPGRRTVYGGTLDRVVIDPYGRLWILDYKTAKRIDTSKLETDPQVTSYLWAGSYLYSLPIEGVVYQQHLKDFPEAPPVLKKGGLSQNKNLHTTYELYRQALRDLYGKITPSVRAQYGDMLNHLAASETAEGDRFVRMDLVRRNEHFAQAELAKILAETKDMLTPKLPLYPNPTKDCSWDCSFQQVCLGMDDGSDWETMLEDNFRSRYEMEGAWQNLIQWPDLPMTEPSLSLSQNP